MSSAILEKTGIDQNSMLLSTLDSAPTGHLVLSHDFTVMFWNRCMEIWTDIDRNSIIGTDIFTHFSHLNVPKYKDRIKGVFHGGPPVVFSSQLHKYVIPSRLASGKLRIQHTTVNKIANPQSGKYQALFSIQDVTSLTDALNINREALRRVEAEIEERKRAEETLEKTVNELKTALDEIETLRRIFPICASCKKIRDDQGYWTQLESYFHKHSIAEFSHGICPDCLEKLYPEYAAEEEFDADQR